ncbi:hypothetical protein PIB30_001782 [Stylosanthes scabra]|uniref:RNase H type-1 domain-containing protein n=1 Tax=Stylosanthes scabra TaxID=79078 RepID=A0ABU6V4D4_9FABA|nr:hypothetical protein [Stylosanthes scabra]
MEDGVVKAWMGEIKEERIKGEALIDGVCEAIQWLLEEVGVREENLKVILDNKVMSRWNAGETGTTWEQRFLKNKVLARKDMLKGLCIEYKHQREFQWKKERNMMAEV